MISKKKMVKKSVTFQSVSTFFFKRCISMDKIPDRGAHPLGMELNHFDGYSVLLSQQDNIVTSTPRPGKQIPKKFIEHDHSSDDCESIASCKSIESIGENMVALTPKQRKECLKAAGIVIPIKCPLSAEETKSLNKIRIQRNDVGCKCAGKCDENKCSCARSNIRCQSDGRNFPCKCGIKCTNKWGTKIYNFNRIKYHYDHTLAQINENIDNGNEHGECIQCIKIDDKRLPDYSCSISDSSQNYKKLRSKKVPKLPQKLNRQKSDTILSAQPTISPSKIVTVAPALTQLTVSPLKLVQNDFDLTSQTDEKSPAASPLIINQNTSDLYTPKRLSPKTREGALNYFNRFQKRRHSSPLKHHSITRSPENVPPKKFIRSEPPRNKILRNNCKTPPNSPNDEPILFLDISDNNNDKDDIILNDYKLRPRLTKVFQDFKKSPVKLIEINGEMTDVVKEKGDEPLMLDETKINLYNDKLLNNNNKILQMRSRKSYPQYNTRCADRLLRKSYEPRRSKLLDDIYIDLTDNNNTNTNNNNNNKDDIDDDNDLES